MGKKAEKKLNQIQRFIPLLWHKGLPGTVSGAWCDWKHRLCFHTSLETIGSKV